MDLNNLLNNAVLQSNLKQLPAEVLARPQVIQALVLSSTLLPQPQTQAQPQGQQSGTILQPQLPALTPSPPGQTADAAKALLPALTYRVAVQWQGRILQLLSPQPLPQGQKVELQVSPRGEVLLLPPNKTGLAAAAAPVASTTPQVPLPPSTPPALQPLPQALRELLPRQQPLQHLVPILQKLADPKVREQLPQPLARAVTQLLDKLPVPRQLQSGEGVKQAVANSGSLFEARLARAAVQPPGAAADAVPKIIESDVKAQILQVVALLKRFGFTAPPSQPARSSHTAVPADELVYNPRTMPRSEGAPKGSEPLETVDSLLNQLGKLLLGGLARIQLHQLDSAATRYPTGAENQPQVPSWVFELPLPGRHGADSLQLRIEQRHQQAQAGKLRVQWTVQLAFDLHELGKLAATLTVLDRNVAATLWSERERTHHAVQAEIDHLRNGLESIGVKVTEVQCRLGLPPDRGGLLQQQLVDVHT